MIESEVSPVLSLVAELSTALHNINMGVQRAAGISLVQFETLRVILGRPGIPAGELSRLTGVHPSTTTQVLKRLEVENWIVISEHPRDCRKRMIVVTMKGRLMFDKSKEILRTIAVRLKTNEGEFKTCLDACYRVNESRELKIDIMLSAESVSNLK